MWLFATSNQLKLKATELCCFIGEWINNINEEPSRKEIKIYLDAAKELLSISEHVRGIGLNAASRRLTETLGHWHAEAGSVRCALNDNPRYWHVIDLVVKIERAIAKI